MILEIF